MIQIRNALIALKMFDKLEVSPNQKTSIKKAAPNAAFFIQKKSET